MKIVILGLSITSSWGNGHATTYRGLVRELARRGHEVLFLERDASWYASNRDMPRPPYGRTLLYRSVAELKERHGPDVRGADLVIVGSFVPEGASVGEWVTRSARGVSAFYDIDTPVTLASLETGGAEYLTPALVRRYDLYLSFTGGPILQRIERQFGAPRARVLYCSFDPELYHPEETEKAAEPIWDLGYLGTYSTDRQARLEQLLLEPARRLPSSRMVVAGPQYPPELLWPSNVERVTHLAPSEHRGFYTGQRFTLNVTRDQMVRAGWSPSVRLFEAAACAAPIISDWWAGLDDLFVPGEEILLSRSPEETLSHLRLPDRERQEIGLRGHLRVAVEHTAASRVAQLEGYYREITGEAAVRSGA